jgi:NAD+ dependent glucose-6-phosphate dehydrogenase
MKGRDRILITGAAGLIGSILRPELARHRTVTALDRVASNGGVVADAIDLDALTDAFAGHDVVIDLAARPSAELPWQDVYANNIPATRNVLEAALRAGVRRVVYASSNSVTGAFERDEPYASVLAGRYDGLRPEDIPRLGADAPIRPDSFYGIGKACGEASCRYYADAHGLSTICLRIGTVNAEDRPLKPRHFAKLLTHRDLVALIERCVDAPASVRHAIFYGVSANTWRCWEIESATRLVGYEPRDDAERWR